MRASLHRQYKRRPWPKAGMVARLIAFRSNGPVQFEIRGTVAGSGAVNAGSWSVKRLTLPVLQIHQALSDSAVGFVDRDLSGFVRQCREFDAFRICGRGLSVRPASDQPLESWRAESFAVMRQDIRQIAASRPCRRSVKRQRRHTVRT